MFDKKMASQVVAYFLWREGGKSSNLRIMKLIYLAEREFLLSYGYRLTGDNFISMKSGPVLSCTLKLIQNRDEASNIWEKWIKEEPNYYLRLAKKVNGIEDFDQFNTPIRKTLEHTYQKYNQYDECNTWFISNQKDEYPEWQDPGSSSLPITIKDILKSHGKTEEETERIIDYLEEVESLKEFVGNQDYK